MLFSWRVKYRYVLICRQFTVNQVQFTGRTDSIYGATLPAGQNSHCLSGPCGINPALNATWQLLSHTTPAPFSVVQWLGILLYTPLHTLLVVKIGFLSSSNTFYIKFWPPRQSLCPTLCRPVKVWQDSEYPKGIATDLRYPWNHACDRSVNWS